MDYLLYLGFQTWIGFADVKSTAVYFYLQRTTNYVATKTVVTFEVTKLNVGNAMNAATGTFVAPRSGKYFFAASGLTNSDTAHLHVQLQLNGASIGRGSGVKIYDTFSIQSTLQLSKGDQIRLFLQDGTIHDNNEHHTHFVGFLLEESVFQ